MERQINLVTGGTGFIGSAVVRHLLERGEAVRVLVRRGSDLRNLAGLPVELAYGDLRDRNAVREAIRGCQRLYHVAASYRLWSLNPEELYEVNVDGTRNILEAAGEEGVGRIVYTSSVGALGIPTGGLGTEATPVTLEDMVGHYKRSKFLAEALAREMVRKGLPVVIVNPSTPVGPRDVKPTPTGQVIVDFLNGKMVGYIDTGLNLIDVDDVAEGHILAAERGRVGERYILGHRNLTLKEIFDLLARITGLTPPRLRLPYRSVLPLAYLSQWTANWITKRPPSIPLEGVKMAKRFMFFEASKAVEELGLPQRPVEMALQKAVKWFLDNGYVKPARRTRITLQV